MNIWQPKQEAVRARSKGSSSTSLNCVSTTRTDTHDVITVNTLVGANTLKHKQLHTLQYK